MSDNKKYHIWTESCQMNVADSLRVASALEQLGYHATRQAEEADVVVLNTCVVRQSAEDKAYGRLHSLHPLKKRFPFVDVFSPPSDPGPLVSFLTQDESRRLEESETGLRQ